MNGDKPEGIESFLARIPPPDEIRRRICDNLREQRALKQLLKLSESQHSSDDIPECLEVTNA